MPLSFETTEKLFLLGEFERLVSAMDATEASLRRLEPEQGVLVAHALAQVGKLQTARWLANHFTADRERPTLRSKAHVVLGIVSECDGRMLEALEHFQLAARLALLEQDHVQTAWARLRLFRHLVDRTPTKVITGMLPEVRRVVTRAGTAHTTAYLHQCIAGIEGQLGRLDEASRHCDIIDSLLATAPNAWLATGNLVNRACVALLECDYPRAIRYLSDRRFEGVRSGPRGSTAAINLAHCQLLTGQFAKALATLGLITTSEKSPHLSVIGAYEGAARVQLAEGHLDECEATFLRIDEEVRKDPDLANTFHVRWSAISKARLLVKRGRAYEAAEMLREQRARLSATHDQPLKALSHLTEAQALTRCNHPVEASGHLLEASRLGIAGFRELQGQYYLGSASTIADDSSRLRSRLRDRARRLFERQGTVSIPLEMALDSHVDANPRNYHDDSDRARSTTCLIVDAMAAVIDLAHSPRLMGAELIAVLRDLGLSETSKLIERRAGASQPSGGEASEQLLIDLGVDGKQQLAVSVPAPTSPQIAIAMGGVLRLAEAALALQRFRVEEKRRAAFWSPEAGEETAGALFVAEEMHSLLATARRVATTNVPVLITGETGTGKEILARIIHAHSNRAKRAFLPFNCTGTPRDMLDSQLFGHRRGSFTGALESFQGVIRAANGGTLLLDEIGDMPLEVQPKLLRFLESGEIHPVGEAQPIHVDVRIIAATNANLDLLVPDGRFREDLFYRLNIVRFHVPALRERRVEIPALANHYLHKYAQEFGKGELRLAEETMEYLVLYRWPGNVRQLANEMRRMAALCESGAVLMPEHLSPEIAASRRTIPASERTLAPHEVVVRLDQPLAAATQHLERAILQYAFDKTGGRMEETATLLGLSRKGLYLKRQRLGIEPPSEATAGAA